MALGFDYSSSGRRLDDQAREELRARAEEIVRSYLGEPNRRLSTKRQLRWHPKGSFVLNVAGDRAGLWYDHAAKAGGDIVDFIRHQRGCSIMFAPNRRCEEHKRSGVRVNRRKKHASRSRLARRPPARKNIFPSTATKQRWLREEYAGGVRHLYTKSTTDRRKRTPDSLICPVINRAL